MSKKEKEIWKDGVLCMLGVHLSQDFILRVRDHWQCYLNTSCCGGHQSVTPIPCGWILLLRERRLGSSLIHVQLPWSCWAVSWITSFNTHQNFIAKKFRSHLPKAYNCLKVEPIRSPDSKCPLPSVFGSQDLAGRLA